MAAPVLQAEGALAGVTTGNLSVTVPAHIADDIICVATIAHVPNSAASIVAPDVPFGWTRVVSQLVSGGAQDDYLFEMYWLRANASGNTFSLTRPGGWDTGNDTFWGGRAWIIRGCRTSGDPYDEIEVLPATGSYTTSNGAAPGLTVLAADRLLMQFHLATEAVNPTIIGNGYTFQTGVTNTAGTDGAVRTATLESDATVNGPGVTRAAPAAGRRYIWIGVSWASPQPVLQTTDYRFRNDDGNETSATWMAAQDTDVELAPGDDFRLRWGLSNLASGSAPRVADSFIYFTYRVDGGSNWVAPQALGGTTELQMKASANIANGAATTEQLIGPLAFVAGHVRSTDNGNNYFNLVTDLDPGEESEFEVSMHLASDVPVGTVIEIRLFDSVSIAEISFNARPTITVIAGGPALTPISLAGNMTVTPTISRLRTGFRTHAVGLTAIPTLARQMFDLKSLSSTLTSTISVVKSFPRPLPLGVTISPTIERIATRLRTHAATVTFTAVVSRLATRYRVLAAALTFTAALTRLRIAYRTHAASLNFTNTVSGLKGVGRTLPATVTLTATAEKSAAHERTFSGSLTFDPALTRLALRLRAFVASLTLSGALTTVRTSARLLATSITHTPALERDASLIREFNQAVTFTPVLARRGFFYRLMALSLNSNPNLATVSGGIRTRQFDAALNFTPVVTLLKLLDRLIAADVNFTATMQRRIFKLISMGASLLLTPSMNRWVTRLLSLNFSLTGALISTRKSFRALPGNLTASVTMTRVQTRVRALAASMNFTNTLARLKKADRSMGAGLEMTPTIQRKVALNPLALVGTLLANLNFKIMRQFNLNFFLNANMPGFIRQAVFNLGLTFTPTFQRLVSRFTEMLGRVGLRRPHVLATKMDEPEIMSVAEPDEDTGPGGRLSRPHIHKTEIKKGDIDG